MEIGNRIKSRREELGMSQEELAKKVGYKSRSSVNKIETDGRGLPQNKIVLFAKALQTTPAYLMGWIDIAEENKPTKEELNLFRKNTYEYLVIKEMEKMNQKGKVKLLDTAREMVCSPLYNPDYKKEISTVHAETDINTPDHLIADAAHDMGATPEQEANADRIMMDDDEWK